MAPIVEKGRVATFALSRFRRIAATGQIHTRAAEFSPETYARQAFGIVGGEKTIKVRLVFEPKLAVYITERQWHPSQAFRVRADGRIEMRLETTGRKERVLSASVRDFVLKIPFGATNGLRAEEQRRARGH